jgi:hypothetical protein
MSFEDAMAVRSSDVYEYKGLAKPLLTLMYQLIERAEEDEEPSEHEGTAWASQQYLAAQLGCSESQVRKLIKRFHLDGWLLIDEKRDAFGHPHYSYKPPDNALKRLTDHKMKMNGRSFVRAKVPQQARAEQWRKNLRKEKIDVLLDSPPNGNPNGGAMATLSSRRSAVEPYGDPPPSSTAARPHPSRRSAAEGVGVVPSLSESRFGNQTNKPTHQFTSFEHGATPKPTPTTSGTPSPNPSRGVYGELPEPHPAPGGKAVASLQTSSVPPRRSQAELDRILEARRRAVHRGRHFHVEDDDHSELDD